MKRVIKFRFENQEGFLSVFESTDAYYALVLKDTKKIDAIEQTHHLEISYELKPTNYQSVHVDVIFEASKITWIYEQLKNIDNLYFETLDDTICALSIKKEV